MGLVLEPKSINRYGTYSRKMARGDPQVPVCPETLLTQAYPWVRSIGGQGTGETRMGNGAPTQDVRRLSPWKVGFVPYGTLWDCKEDQ